MTRVIVTLAALMLGCGEAATLRETSNASCGSCHASHASAFEASPHARATESDLFRAMRARADVGTAAFCDRCHSPHEAPGERGVGCVTCHTAIATRGVSNARLVHDHGVIQGPFDDPRPSMAHPSQRSDFLRSAEFCGTCHEVAGPGALVETPYTEWARSPARAQGVTCVDCHMSATPGDPTQVAARAPVVEGGAPRARTDHAFVGPEHPRAAELFARSATIDLDVRDTSGDHLDVRVGVTNLNTGHALPSGARFAREVWIELVAIDDRGETHAVTGALAPDGAPIDDPQRVDFGDRATRGGVHALPFEADRHEVRALAARERRVFALQVPHAWGARATVRVRARLRYRRNAWALRRALGLAADTSPVLELAQAERAVP